MTSFESKKILGGSYQSQSENRLGYGVQKKCIHVTLLTESTKQTSLIFLLYIISDKYFMVSCLAISA